MVTLCICVQGLPKKQLSFRDLLCRSFVGEESIRRVAGRFPLILSWLLEVVLAIFGFLGL